MNIDCGPIFLTGNGSLSNRNSPQLLQRTLTNLSRNNIKMRSLGLSGVYDQPLLTIDPANNFISYNGSNNNLAHHHELTEFNERTKRSSYQKDGGFIQNNIARGMTPPPSKTRVPDILLINKYYGLVPQKFAISSRKQASVSSTPSSASSSSRRATKSNSARPRAKSSSLQHHHQRQEERKMKEGKGHRSENDSPEPIKMVLVARKGSIGSESRENNSTDPFGPVTKRMSVEKYKKWRNNGGGHKGINLNMEGSIGQTLSLLENGLKSHARKNGGVASADYLNNRRVIKIDLNSVSWDEENYEVPPSPERTTARENEEKPSEESDVSSSTFNGENNNPKSRRQDSSSSMGSLSSFDDNGCFTYWVNNNNKSDVTLANEGQTEQSGLPDKDERFLEKSIANDTHAEMTSKQTFSPPNLLVSTSERQEDLSFQNAKIDASSESKVCKGKYGAGIDSSGENIPKALHDQKVATMKGCGKLSQRTISFDEKLLESCNGVSEGADKADNCPAAKRRPTTATARCPTKTFSTPNGFNPPSKVIPWTQQKTSGGKPLTLAERRAKFQRVPSIHSSSSLSIETGEEEGLSEELDTNVSSNCIRPPSSAFKESRKPLYVMQPAEVPTMISQINPNADEDIQIEIEKVAIMLRKMQSLKQFSRSLDSGIEAEMANRSHSVPECASLCTNVKSVQNADKLLSTNLDDSGGEVVLENENTSASLSSVSSMDSNSSDDQSQTGNKLKSSFSTEPTTTRVSEHDGNPKRGDTTPARDGSIDRLSTKNRGSNSTNSTSSSSNSTLRKNSTSSSTSSPQAGNSSTSTTTKTTVHRPPLKKAVSISCEKELLKPGGGYRQNEVNSSAGDHAKSGRPKTAVDRTAPTSSQKGYGAGTRATHINNGHRQSSVSSSESQHADSPSGSQGSRNRKILIKKALMEINQSSVNLRRKWGTLGRPRTAPSSEKNVSQQGTMSQQQHPVNAQQRRRPLKASPITISGDGKTGFSSSGKSSLSGVGKSCGEMERGNLEKSSSVGGASQLRANSESREETGDNSEQHANGDSSSSYGRGRSAFRQSFSLDESALLGFSIKSVNEGRMPIFERLDESSAASEPGSMSILNDEVSFLSSKKREQCLKVYEKMTKTGCAIKLDTVFRGMLTPSEYRAFMKAAEKATLEAEEKAREEEESELEKSQSEEQDIGE